MEDAVLAALAALPRGAQTELPPVERVQAPAQPRLVTETMDVTQGKLAMGYRCGSDDYPAMVLANLIFGGTSNSKLFLNVREKLSLCYYASSSYARSKGILTVSSGVETKDFRRAEEEIGRQLAAVQQGDWEDWEQEGALQAIRASLLSLSDSQGALENFYLGQIASGVEETPEVLQDTGSELTEGAHHGGGTDGEAGYGVLPERKGGGVNGQKAVPPHRGGSDMGDAGQRPAGVHRA